jgi:glycosyltransferase involved in cell wall biosynthesis
VSFLGQLESAAPVIRSADAVVNCSRNEAFGRVTVEGMLAGKPVVGAASAGTAELIRHGCNGFLYEPGDVGQLVEILRRLIEDPAEGHCIGQAAYLWASARFTEQRFGEELAALLREAGPLHA